MLQRIYGTAWADAKELKAYLDRLEEAERRDHRKVGGQMDLFHFQDEAVGAVFWHTKGWQLFRTLVDFMRAKQGAAGYREVNTPELMSRSLWEASGHWVTFRENMFTSMTADEQTFVVKPMNCPGHIQVFKNDLRSYRDLPYRLAEFGKVHRYEPSGALHGLMRVRAFTQDDAHVFCTEAQVTEEAGRVCQLLLDIYRGFGFDNVLMKFADRPPKRVGADDVWDRAEAALKNAMDTLGLQYSLNKGEGAFYGPKIEFVLRDAIGRDWQCGTLQVDLNMPARLGATYIGEDGNTSHARDAASRDLRLARALHRDPARALRGRAAVLAGAYANRRHDDHFGRRRVRAGSRCRAYACGPARRARSAQREDQLQGTRAQPRQDPRDSRGGQARGRRAYRRIAALGIAEPDELAAHRGRRPAARRSRGARRRLTGRRNAMRVMSFETNGRPGFGVVVGDGVVDASARLAGQPRGLREALAAGALPLLERFAAMQPDFALRDVAFAPVIPDAAAKLICVGINYMPHIREMGRERPDRPVLFVRFGDSIVGHGQALRKPRESEQFDFEGELAVVIGKRARRVGKERALDYVAGYSCFNDGSIRDFQRHSAQFTPGKNFHASGAFGPWLVTTDEIADPRQLTLTTRLNGAVMQHESVGELCFDVPQLIEYCSTFTQLEPGDVIVTGTPGGVGAGRKPPVWMRPGDSIEVDISGIGTLRNSVIADPAA